jgi:acyl-CoA thioesterase-1
MSALLRAQILPLARSMSTSAITGPMIELIATTAKEEDVDLFRRFDVMKRWREVDHMAFETFVSSDGLHMNDWSYACMAKGLGLAIAEAAQRPVVSAKAMSHLVH